MNIVEIVQELLDYLHTHNGNRRTCDAMEECLELLKTDLTEEQKKREVKRVGDTISFLLEQEEEMAVGDPAKTRFSDNIRKRLKNCHQACVAMAESKSLEQQPLVQGFESDFLTEMNVQLNGKQMQEREGLSELVNRSRIRLSDSIRSVAKEFAENIMDEFEFCMDKVRKAFAETTIEEYRTSYREMNETVLVNYDIMQRSIAAENTAYEYPAAPFNDFVDDIGVKMEKVAKKEHGITVFLKLLPLIIYGVKYVVDNYIIQKETWMDKLINFLISQMRESVQEDKWVQVLEIILQFAADHQKAFEITSSFLLTFLFFGWLYYIYVKIVGNVRKKSLYRKQQAVMRPAVEKFLREFGMKEEIRNALVEKVQLVEEQYMQKHRLLFEKIMRDSPKEESENILQRLQGAYEEYIERI